MHRILLVATVLLVSRNPIYSGPPSAEPSLADLAQASFKAAQATYDQLVAEKRSGSFDPERLYFWSKRLLEAQGEAARDPAEKVKAFQDHLDRMKKLEPFAKKWYDPKSPVGGLVTATQFKAVGFFIAEAEFWLTRAKKTKK